MSNPHEWFVAQDAEGFFVSDEYGEDLTPHHRFTRYSDAVELMNELIEYELDNYEPPDPPGWEGGFADNH